MSSTFRFSSLIIFLLSFSQFSLAASECTSAERNSDGTAKYTIRYYKPYERPDSRNQFANLQIYESGKTTKKDSTPLTYTLCVAKPSGYGTLVRCENTMGFSTYLMIETIHKSAAYQDGPLKLFNMSCKDLKTPQ